MPDMVLDELRLSVLKKNGIKNICPSDCKYISIDIQKELNKNISETTLKRFFGFANAKHPFSKFTINTLKEYVDNQENDNELGFLKNLNVKPNIEKIKQTALQTTLHTLKNIRNRCSVPFEMTINRKFAKYDFEFFYNSAYSFTSFIAQPGYGKSILLHHLVDDLFISEQARFKDDVIFFINAEHIFNIENKNLNIDEEIKLKLNIPKHIDLINYFNEQYEKNGVKLIIVIDGFSELVISKHFKPKIFDSIINLISTIENNNSIKMALSMRCTTWSRFYQRVRHAHFLKNKWFSGSYFNANDNSNIPPLNEKELEQVLQKINPNDLTKINSNLKSQLKFPFHIHWYYKLKEEYPEFSSYTNIIFFEIISKFIQEHIYNTNYATEKIIFCKKLIQLTDNGTKGQAVVKTELIKEIAIFKNAYMQLLTDGILMEEKQYRDGYYIEVVRFIYPHVFEYFLFIELLDTFDQKIDEIFFRYIQNEHESTHLSFQLLQWSIRLIIIQKRFEKIEFVLNLMLNNYEKNYLIYFIAENLRYRYKNNDDVIHLIKAQQVHQLLIDNLLHFDFVDSCYRESIKSLLEVVDTDENAFIYHSILSILDCLSLDTDRILHRLESIEKLNIDTEKWIINPYEALKIIYIKTKGITLTNDATLNKIEVFKNDVFSLGIKAKKLPDTKQKISYLTMLVTNLFYGSPKEATKIISSVIKLHPKLIYVKNDFSTYMLNLIAQACTKSNLNDKTDQMERILDHIFENSSNNRFTFYNQILFFAFKAEQCKNRKEYNLAIQYANDCITAYKRNDLVINQVFMYNLLIDIYTKMDELELANEYMYQKLSLFDDKKASPFPLHILNRS